MENEAARSSPKSIREAISQSLNYIVDFLQAIEEPLDDHLDVRLARVEKELEDLKQVVKGQTE